MKTVIGSLVAAAVLGGFVVSLARLPTGAGVIIIASLRRRLALPLTTRAWISVRVLVLVLVAVVVLAGVAFLSSGANLFW